MKNEKKKKGNKMDVVNARLLFLLLSVAHRMLFLLSVYLETTSESGVSDLETSMNDFRCTCCPYGYHLDTDFMKFLDDMYGPDVLRTLKRMERKRHDVRRRLINEQQSVGKQGLLIWPVRTEKRKRIRHISLSYLYSNRIIYDKLNKIVYAHLLRICHPYSSPIDDDIRTALRISRFFLIILKKRTFEQEKREREMLLDRENPSSSSDTSPTTISSSSSLRSSIRSDDIVYDIILLPTAQIKALALVSELWWMASLERLFFSVLWFSSPPTRFLFPRRREIRHRSTMEWFVKPFLNSIASWKEISKI